MFKYEPEANLHGFYLVKTNAVYKTIGHADFAAQTDQLARSLVLGLWKGQSLTEDHVKAMNDLYSKGQPKPSYLYWELVSAAGEAEQPPVPDFFRVLVLTNPKAARLLTEGLRALLVRLSDPNRGNEQENRFLASAMGALEAVLESDDPLGFRELSRGPVPGSTAGQSAGAAARQGEKEKEEELPPPEKLEDLLEELDSLVGLEKIKTDVRSLINLIKVRKLRTEAELPVPELSLHMVFTGNPGTGKTTVARLLSRLYRSIGVLKKGTLLEVDRSGLVAGYVGQTALKTLEAVKKAQGGILFVDEAYSLVPEGAGNDFGQEAISTILKAMEDMREELVVIVAGYPEPMERFISSNPGLESRFGKYFHFEDYTGEELMRIFESLCRKNKYELEPEAETFCRDMFNALYQDRDENFGNARDVRNIFERSVANQANRLAAMEAPTKEDLMTFLKEDIVGEKPAEKAEEKPKEPDSED